MKPLVLTLFFLNASAFAQNTHDPAQLCRQIVSLEQAVGKLLVKFTENHPDIVLLRKEIEAQRTLLQQVAPGYVCKSPIATSQSQQPEDLTAGIIGPQPNVAQPNILQPNGRSYACAELQAAAERVREQREQISEPVRLSTAEVALAETRMAASQGLNCSATELKPERTKPAAAEPAR